MPKTILFLGATGGCVLSTLRRSLAAGHTCIALCRTPSSLLSKLTPAEQAAVHISQGNAHDAAALRAALSDPSVPPHTLVDYVISGIGNPVTKEGVLHPDVDVCRKGMEVLLEVVAGLRGEGFTGRVRVLGISSTGVSDFGRDIPIAMIPLYKVMLHVPHKDKKGMEDLLVASGEEWTVVRPSWLTNGEGGVTDVRAGMEDPERKEVVTKAVGYTISREDVGKWIFENVVEEVDGKWVKRIASLTY
ncbi:hypothetical protein B0T25DRAFT_565347 [Lasiosphaeria hispida]|uniref:NAD(P)-binding domain-containing protein n=1 Tax=Lasiosphaeria hispida TaxID=260671 RepID=A0AAJ0HS66_9PEZI|nr:hypothetical protein B0T25DRAFT_565347 [Lasiosphaeria hispida]